jgi:hypothetical protein
LEKPPLQEILHDTDNTGETTCQEWMTQDITVPKMENYKPTRREELLEKQSNDV